MGIEIAIHILKAIIFLVSQNIFYDVVYENALYLNRHKMTIIKLYTKDWCGGGGPLDNIR